MKIIIMIIKIGLILAVLAGFTIIGIKGKADDILLIFTAIGTISGLVFTVAGLWAGFVFPEAIKIILSNSSTHEKTEKCREYKNILVPVLLALICVVMSAFVPLMHRLFKAICQSDPTIMAAKISGAVFAGILLLLLIWSIYSVISPSISWFNILRKRTDNEVKADKKMPKN